MTSIDLRKDFEKVLRMEIKYLQKRKQILNKEYFALTSRLLICERELRKSIRDEFEMLKRVNQEQIENVRCLLDDLSTGKVFEEEGALKAVVYKSSSKQLGKVKSKFPSKLDQASKDLKKLVKDLSARGYDISENLVVR